MCFRESHEVFIDDDDLDYKCDDEGEQYAEEEYYEEEAVEEGEGDVEELNDGACAQLCEGMDAMNLTMLKGLPAASGSHIRFEDDEEEEEDVHA